MGNVTAENKDILLTSGKLLGYINPNRGLVPCYIIAVYENEKNKEDIFWKWSSGDYVAIAKKEEFFDFLKEQEIVPPATGKLTYYPETQSRFLKENDVAYALTPEIILVATSKEIESQLETMLKTNNIPQLNRELTVREKDLINSCITPGYFEASLKELQKKDKNILIL